MTDGRRLPVIDGRTGRPFEFANELWVADQEGRGHAVRARIAAALLGKGA